MTTFKTHTIESAPEQSRAVLEQAKKLFGAVPNLLGVFAESPAILKAYVTLADTFENSSSLNPTERQVVLLTTSFENECEYCMAAHSVVARMQGVAPEVVRSLRDGRALLDQRLEALRAFTRKIVQNRGWLAEEDVDAFLAAGFSNRQVLEVILAVGIKTLSNYTNHIAKTPVDKAFESQAWTRPTTVSAA